MSDDLERRRVLRLAAAGVMANVIDWIPQALAKGDKPLAPGIHHLEGSATVNGREAKVGTGVNPGDRVSTGNRSQAVIVVGSDAFLLRGDTTLEVRGREGALSELNIVTGKVLSVFAKKPVAIKAASASIGIRGTGGYIEVDAATVYFCLCYGEALLEAPGISPLELKTAHHEKPLLLHTSGPGVRVEPGPFRDHRDSELILLESLVGREPPFVGQAAYPAGKY
jgi:hypothetical protein